MRTALHPTASSIREAARSTGLKRRKRTVLQWIIIGGCTLVVCALALGLWVWSVLPAPQGEAIVLQQALFTGPAQPYTEDERFLYRSATELAAMIHNKEATATEITHHFIARIKNHNHQYNALIWLREEEALADAAKADAAIANGDTVLGPLHGVPITIKEQFWVKGSRIHKGMMILAVTWI